MWLKAFLVLLVLNLTGLYGLYVLFGGGEAYRDLTSTPLIQEQDIQPVLHYSLPIGGLAVSDKSEVFFVVHPQAQQDQEKLFTWRNGKAVAFPNETFQSEFFSAPSAIAIDRQQRLWVVDHGAYGFSQPSVWAFDSVSGDLVFELQFEKQHVGLGSYLQDIQVDSSGRFLFVSDLSLLAHDPALLVVDTHTNEVRRLLAGHESLQSQDWLIEAHDEPFDILGGIIAFKPGLDGIVLDNDDEYLYYGAMANDTLYRIQLAHLLDIEVNDAVRFDQIQAMGHKPISDGLSIDSNHNIYITDVEHGAILKMQPNGDLSTLIKTPKLRWADALSFGPDGWLYVSDSALHQVTDSSYESILAQGPYYIYRIQTGEPAVAGH